MGFLNFLKDQVLSNGKAVTNLVQAGASLISPKLGRGVSKIVNSPAARFLKKAVNQVARIAEAIETGTPEEIVKAVKGAVGAGKKLLKKNKAKAETAARARTKKQLKKAVGAQPDLPQSQISDTQLRDLQGRAAGGVL